MILGGENMEYTKKEEVANSLSHGIGAILSIVALVVMVVFAAFTGDKYKISSVCIFGISLIILYTMSTIYHAITNENAKKVLRIIDHSSVYLLIAGTYTPYALIILRQNGAIGWYLFAIIWSLAILGILFSIKFTGRFKILTTFLYIAMGWIIIFVFPQMWQIMQSLNIIDSLYWLLASGVFYTIGTVFYILKKVKYFHSIWHLFVILGSVCSFISVMFYII